MNHHPPHQRLSLNTMAAVTVTVSSASEHLLSLQRRLITSRFHSLSSEGGVPPLRLRKPSPARKLSIRAARIESKAASIGFRAPDFQLLPELLTGKMRKLKDFEAFPALLVMLICNHWPFVKHLKKDNVKLPSFYMKKRLEVVAIPSNCVATYPQDGPQFMAEAKLFSNPFPYLLDKAATLLGPPARFEASKLKVVLMGQKRANYEGIVPRTYTLSHCDFTANLTLTISNVIQLDQLKGWYNKDDVVAEWKQVKGDMYLDVHCYLSGPNPFLDVAAEFRYHIFSKEMPLVLKAVMHGDSLLFKEHQELKDALVRVYFHSSSKKYNHMECWGPLKDAAQGKRGDQINSLLKAGSENSNPSKVWGSRNSIFQALVTFLL